MMLVNLVLLMSAPMNRTAPVSAALTLALLTACSGEESGPGGTTVTDSAGVRIVDNSGSGSWGEGEAWTFEEVFRVGGIDGEETERFGLVIGVDVDAEGRVYIADQQAKEVRVFAPDGSYLSTVGGPGEGPGEIGAGFMGVFERDGEVWTIDPVGQGIQRYSLEAGYLGAQPFSIEDGIPFRMDEADLGVVAQRRGFDVDRGVSATGDPITTIGTEQTDTLMQLPLGLTIAPGVGESEMSMDDVSLLAPEPRWDIADGGATAVGMDNVYRIEVMDAGQTLDRVITRDVEPIEITEGMKSMLRRAMAEQMEAFGAPAGVIAPMLEQLSFAETAPIFVQLALEGDGHLWVQRTSTVRDAAEQVDFDINDLGSNRWDIFDPEGRYLGEMEVPDGFQVLRLIDGVLWGFDRDEFDVQSVVGLRVVR